MDKAKELELTVQRLLDALIKAGATAVGLPQLVELHTTAEGYLDIPLRVRVSV